MGRIVFNITVGQPGCGNEKSGLEVPEPIYGPVIQPGRTAQRSLHQAAPVFVENEVPLPVMARKMPCVPAIRTGHQPEPLCGNPGIREPRWVAKEKGGKIAIVPESLGKPRYGKRFDPDSSSGYDSGQVMPVGFPSGPDAGG